MQGLSTRGGPIWSATIIVPLKRLVAPAFSKPKVVFGNVVHYRPLVGSVAFSANVNISLARRRSKWRPDLAARADDFEGLPTKRLRRTKPLLAP